MRFSKRGLHAIEIDPGTRARAGIGADRSGVRQVPPSVTFGRSRPSRTPTLKYQKSRVQGRRRGLRARHPVQPGVRPRVLLPRQQLRQPVQAGQEGRGRERRLPAQGRRELQEGDRQARGADREPGAGNQEAVVRVPDCRLWHRQAQRSGPGAPHRPAADRDRAERADQLSGARQALRGCGPLRRGREPSSRRPSRSSRTTPWPTRRWPVSTTGRATSRRRWRRGIRAPKMEPNNPEAWHMIGSSYQDEVFQNSKKLAASAEAEGIRPGGARGRGQGPGAQPRVLRGADLQEHPPPAHRRTSRRTRRRRSGSSTKPTTSRSRPTRSRRNRLRPRQRPQRPAQEGQVAHPPRAVATVPARSQGRNRTRLRPCCFWRAPAPIAQRRSDTAHPAGRAPQPGLSRQLAAREDRRHDAWTDQRLRDLARRARGR